jgi:ferredoxin
MQMSLNHTLNSNDRTAKQSFEFSVQREQCIQCGQCAAICPQQILAISESDGYPKQIQLGCIGCGHCLAVCPKDAIVHSKLTATLFSSISQEFPAISPEQLFALLSQKRSSRCFQPKSIAPEIIEKIINAANLAPASDNQFYQRRHIIITNPEKIKELELAVANHYQQLLKWLNKPVRRILSLFLKNLLQHLEPLVPDLQSLLPRTLAGQHPIFRGAPAVILTHAPSGNTLSRDNCLAAQHYMMLYAQTLGIGSCIIGYATSAPQAICKIIPIPENHQVFAATILGYPRFPFRKSIIRSVSILEEKQVLGS